MRAFEVGDVVLCVETNSAVERGHEYVIRDTRPGTEFLHVEGKPQSLFKSRFELTADS